MTAEPLAKTGQPDEFNRLYKAGFVLYRIELIAGVIIEPRAVCAFHLYLADFPGRWLRALFGKL